MERSRPLLIFDGECGFCSSSARWVAARWHGRVRAVPWQSLGPDELAGHGLTPEEARSAAWWIDAAGRCFHGHLAIAHALRAGSGWSALVGRVLLLPPFPWLGAAVYPLISRWRYRLPGGTPACRT